MDSEYFSPNIDQLLKIDASRLPVTIAIELVKIRRHANFLEKNNLAVYSDYGRQPKRAAIFRFMLETYNSRVNIAFTKIESENLPSMALELDNILVQMDALGESLGNTSVSRNYHQAKEIELHLLTSLKVVKQRVLNKMSLRKHKSKATLAAILSEEEKAALLF
jgi:hypothetical protein